jgi:hypothetical protein
LPIDLSVLPASVHESHVNLVERSTVAYTAELQHNGHDWLLTSDYALVPKDRVVPYPISRFAGVHLTPEIRLPLAFFRSQTSQSYELTQAGQFARLEKVHSRHSWVLLSGKRRKTDGAEWLQANDGTWVNAADVTVPTPASATPWGAIVGQPDTAAEKQRGRATWIEVSILCGWLIAYEGTQAVFTTLISPGSGGMPRAGQAPIDTYSTPLGRFKITGKFASATMVGPTGLIHSDVPYAQNFSDLYAIHTAYWHDNWGNPMSGGCVNVSPIDGYFLFHWTEPSIPDDWYGVRWIPTQEPATTVIIHR